MQSFRYLERPSEPRIAWSYDPAKGEHRGSVLMIHGYAEHSARYDRVVAPWVERGLSIARFDLRGHGRSEGTRGHVGNFTEYVRDGLAVLAEVEREPTWHAAKRPVLFGHSLGGLIATHVALKEGSRFAGLALTSPFYAVATPVPRVKLALGKIVGKIAPKLRQPSGLSGSDLTHDVALAKAYNDDPLHFDHVTTGWFLQVTEAQRAAMEQAPRLELPFFCIAGGSDRVVSTPEVQRLFARVGSRDKELDVRPGLFHEILNELDYLEHVARLADRMLRWASA